MIRLRFASRLAWREGRGALKKTGLHTLAVALGVGSLVAVHGFRSDAERSVQAEARTLLGADLRLWRRDPLPDSVELIVDSLVASGARSASVLTVPSMVLAESTGTARLFQVREVEGGWPFYGAPETVPPGEWPPEGDGSAWVDPAVLVQLGVEVGDTVLIGDARLEIVASVTGLPTEFGFQTAIGPQVVVSPGLLARAGLLGFGALTRYETYVAVDEQAAAEAVAERYEALLRGTGTGYTTARGRAENLSEGLDALSRYLGVVGLAALLLGGIGVASGVHVFARSKMTSVAVLRCLGATRGLVLFAYVLQAVIVGTLGAVVGAAAGVGLQLLLPGLLGDLLPLAIEPRVSIPAVALGVAVGVWVTLVFALGPLLPLRRVSPLRALRRGFEPEAAAPDRLVVGTRVALVVTAVGLAVLEAASLREGLALAGGLAAALIVLWALALATMAGVRRWTPPRASYPVRQGVSNLFRPQNQTVAVLLALGFGVFAVTTLVQVERNLAEGLSLEAEEGAPNVLLFDIQPAQREDVEAVVAGYASGPPTSTPLVPARIAAIDGRSAAELMADTTGGGPARWAVRREYRNTYRAHLSETEELVAGEWWTEPRVGPYRISLEADQANSLAVDLGARITWNLGGRLVETEVANLRVVDWARFQPNFYVVFEPGLLEGAPHTWLTLAHVDTDDARARLQRDVARRFQNVSVLDLARVQEALGSLLGTVGRAIRLLALLAALAGVAILAGAVAVTRSQRMAEAALLKTLGARRATVLQVLFTEYVALGLLGALGALALAVVASWALVSLVFDLPFRLHAGAAAAVALAVTALSLVAGLAGSRGILSRSPLSALRQMSE